MVNKIKEYFDNRLPVPEFIHNEMMNHFKIFSAIGGMPEVVQKYVDTYFWLACFTAFVGCWIRSEYVSFTFSASPTSV